MMIIMVMLMMTVMIGGYHGDYNSAGDDDGE